MSNRWAEYYRAQQRAMLAEVECFKLNPVYDGDEVNRQRHIASYEEMAEKYGRMADESED